MKKVITCLLCFALLMTETGCSTVHSGNNNRSIVIAVMDTQPVYSSDDSYLNGISMAIEDTNLLYGDMGYDISYEFHNDASMFQQGMAIVNQLADDDRITAVLGTSSLNILGVAADVLDSAGKVLVTYYGSSDSLFDNGYTHVFRNTYGAGQMGAAVAAYGAKQGNMSRIAVYHSDTAYEKEVVRDFMRQVSKTDMTVVDVASSTTLEGELDTLLKRWKDLDVDTVFISQYYAEYAFDMLKRVRTMDPNMNVLGDFSFDYTDDLKNYIDVSNKIYIASLLPIDKSEEVNSFSARYTEKYGVAPSLWAVQMYNSVRMVVDTAVKIGSNDPEDIAKALHGADGYNAVGGQIVFDAAGKLTGSSPRIQVSKNGSFEYVEE